MEAVHLARGYQFAGVHCGIRPDAQPDRLDLALVLSERPAAVAGVFTQNRVAAAPVRVSRERVPREDGRGVVVCSGNANACTGARGLADAQRMASLAATAAGCAAAQMLVCSTGVIGRHLPMPAVEAGIEAAGRALEASPAGFDRASRAILTTDTHAKISSRSLAIGGADLRITGFAKGAAMIGPNMATMLAFVLSDAAVASQDLAAIARRAADRSFNCTSVEGHTSTNDTLLLFANGTGPKLGGEHLRRYEEEVTAVCTDLAMAIAADAEGASHCITLTVEGLRDDGEARRVARTIADSALVKTAIFGADPNWGRIVSAAGYAGVAFEEEEVSLWLGELLLYERGAPTAFDPQLASAYIRDHRDIAIRLRFRRGTGRCVFWTCDLGYEYVRLNAEYTT